MHIKIIDIAARPGSEGLWMYQTHGYIPTPFVGEIITIETRGENGITIQSRWKVVRREWTADRVGLSAEIFVSPEPMGV